MDDVVARQVMEIIAEQAAVDAGAVSGNSTLSELGIDSLGVVETIFAIEERFGVDVPFNANNPAESDFDISNVNAVVAAVRDLLKQNPG